MLYRCLSRAVVPWRAPKLGPSSVAGGREGVSGNRVPEKGPTRSFVALSPGHNHLHYRGRLTDKHLQGQIVNVLRSGDKDKASKMLLSIGKHASFLRAEDFVNILDYCARSPDPLFVLETWRIMNENAVHIDKRCWTFIIQALSNGGYLKEAFRQLTFLGENDSTQPCLQWYNIFLNGCVKSQNIAHANNCLKLMDHQLIGKSEITYWELLKLAVWQENLSLAHEIWRDLRKYYSPSIISLRKFIWSFTRLGDLQSAYIILQYMVSVAVCESDSLRKSGEGRFLSSRLDIPMPALVDLSDGLLNNKGNGFSSRKLNGNLVTTKDALGLDDDYVSSRENNTLGTVEGNFQMRKTTVTISHGTPGNINATDVEKDYLHMQPFSSSSFSNVIRNEHESIAVRKQPSACSTEMMQENGTRIDLRKDVSSAMTRKVLRWSFSDLIHACAQCRKYNMSEQLFLQMLDLGLKPSPHTFDGFVRAIISEKGVTYAMRVVQKIEKRNLKVNDDTFSALSVGYCELLDLDMAEFLLSQISASSPKFIYPFNAFLAACDVMVSQIL
uniref:Pentatricopeptide repeat-containing protein At1g76280 n=1 Tax=Anthurium amnicola TaxID=1678845 RepID=A0A1D1YHD1_9ARAE